MKTSISRHGRRSQAIDSRAEVKVKSNDQSHRDMTWMTYNNFSVIDLHLYNTGTVIEATTLNPS
jgi:hypothetical protein